MKNIFQTPISKLKEASSWSLDKLKELAEEADINYHIVGGSFSVQSWQGGSFETNFQMTPPQLLFLRLIFLCLNQIDIELFQFAEVHF